MQPIFSRTIGSGISFQSHIGSNLGGVFGNSISALHFEPSRRKCYSKTISLATNKEGSVISFSSYENDRTRVTQQFSRYDFAVIAGQNAVIPEDVDLVGLSLPSVF